MSESKPPHLPSTRTGITRAPGATPAMPRPLLAAAPTMLATRVPMGRVLEPDEIAGLAVYPGSRESSGMTGQSILVDGGMLVV